MEKSSQAKHMARQILETRDQFGSESLACKIDLVYITRSTIAMNREIEMLGLTKG